MLTHLFNLLARSFASIPASLGSTWLGLLFPVVVALIGEGIGVAFFGLSVMVQSWKKATGIGFAALGVGYTILFAFCFAKNIYVDHTQLVSVAGSYKQRLVTSDADTQTKIGAVAKEKDGEIEKLKINCAYKEGASGIMQEQLDKQQSALNECLVQQKEMPLTRTYPVSHDTRPGVPKTEYVLTTTTVRTPVEIIASCDLPVSDASLFPMTTTGGSNSSMSTNRVSQSQYKFSILSPAWSPSGPLWVTMFFVPPVNRMPHCSFTVG